MTENIPNWLLAIDVDRTLLTSEYKLLPKVQAAVQHAREHRVTVALVTARAPRALDIVIGELGDIDYAVCFGGALSVVRNDGRWLSHESSAEETLHRDVCRELIDFCRSIGLSLALYGRDFVYVDELDGHLANEFKHTGDIYKVRDLQSIEERPFKFLAICNPGRVDKLDAVKARFDGRLSCAMSHANYLEIGPKGISKASGLAALGNRISIGPERTAAIGDGENDLPMFEYARISIAMGNAPQSVQGAATWVTLGNAEAGVAAAIERLSREIWHIPGPNYLVEESE